MKISVTQTDIDKGDCTYCPVERAFARESLDTMVGPTEVSFFLPLSPPNDGFVLPKEKSYIVTLPLPPIAQEFIKAFDAFPRDPSLPSPFEFDLEIPAEVLEAVT